MQAELAVPLSLRGQLRGIMILGSPLSSDWDEDDRKFIANVSEQIALGIDNLSIGDEVREYERALQIQRALLPSSMPRIEGFDIEAMWKPARTVSGDYFDVIPIDATLAMCIGDVAGKGMPAALLMANLQAAVKASIRDGHSPSEICARVSNVVCSTLQSGAFVTFFLGLLDTRTMTLRYTNAGHNPPVLLRRGGEVIRLQEGGPAFARLMREASYTTREVQLERGDTVFLFTDGVTEARNPGEEEFGEERMLAALRAAKGSSNAIVRELVDQVRDFSHGVVFDDITVVCLRVTGAASNVVPFAVHR
jgi:sigma-B regulation protein RsbU (phosphoserine phosphatase)